MMRPAWRGLTQLFAVTVLPLTVLLLVIAFGGVALHQQDMRMLVGERDERAAQAAAAALESELHHRASTISSLALQPALPPYGADLASDFDGGLALIDPAGRLLAASPPTSWLTRHADAIEWPADAGAAQVFLAPVLNTDEAPSFIVVLVNFPAEDAILAGAFSPEVIARETLTASQPPGNNSTIYLIDSDRRLLYAGGNPNLGELPLDQPEIAAALQGESGTLYIERESGEYVIAYSPVELTGWAVITEEQWDMVISPSLRLTQIAPLVVVPAFVLALVALWFGARQIVQPLQQLESKAAALAWGDFDAIEEPVGGIAEVQHLQRELTAMARKVQAAQEGLHDYIGAITAAQEEERLRLARELHDDTIQAVIALKQRVQLAQKAVKDQGGLQSLRQLESLAEQTIENLRRMTRALRPIYLEDLGLVTALEMLARETNHDDGLQVEFHRSGKEQRLSHEAELALYRIAQEALHNVVRHARATRADLHIRFGEGTTLEVADNGVGFEMPKSPTDFAAAGHFGLLGMRERAELIGARFEVKRGGSARNGAGTRLLVHLPAESHSRS